MKRRTLLIASACIAARPFMAIAQSTRKPYRIGYLSTSSKENARQQENQNAFRAGMRELGYTEGRDFVMEVRYAEDAYDRLPALAMELVRSKVDVIVSPSQNSTRAAQQATRSIPIVMTSGADPVGRGFAQSLARPGGNITGITNVAEAVSPKSLELLLAAVPKLKHIALLTNPDNDSSPPARSVESAARQAGITVTRVGARSAVQLDSAFEMAARERVGALIILPDVVFNTHAQRVAQLIFRHRLPAIAPYRFYAEAGVLMSYGRDLTEAFRRAAFYVDKILKGANPAELPIEQPTRIELVLNLKTAAALGITIPPSLLVRADKVIE